MPKIRYIPFHGSTGLEIRDENGTHLCNILPSKNMKSKEVVNRGGFVCKDCEFTYDELLDAMHKLRKGKL